MVAFLSWDEGINPCFAQISTAYHFLEMLSKAPIHKCIYEGVNGRVRGHHSNGYDMQHVAMILCVAEIAGDVHYLGGNSAQGKDHAHCENHFGDSSSNSQHSLVKG